MPLVDLDRALIGTMKEVARAKSVRWDISLRADADPANGRTWQRLREVARAALPHVTSGVPKTAPSPLQTSPGLLQRYGQLSWLSELAQTTGRGDGVFGAWLLVPWEDPCTPPAPPVIRFRSFSRSAPTSPMGGGKPPPRGVAPHF